MATVTGWLQNNIQESYGKIGQLIVSDWAQSLKSTDNIIKYLIKPLEVFYQYMDYKHLKMPFACKKIIDDATCAKTFLSFVGDTQKVVETSKGEKKPYVVVTPDQRRIVAAAEPSVLQRSLEKIGNAASWVFNTASVVNYLKESHILNLGRKVNYIGNLASVVGSTAGVLEQAYFLYRICTQKEHAIRYEGLDSEVYTEATISRGEAIASLLKLAGNVVNLAVSILYGIRLLYPEKKYPGYLLTAQIASVGLGFVNNFGSKWIVGKRVPTPAPAA